MTYFNYNPYFCYRQQKVINYLKSGGRIPKGQHNLVATLPGYTAPSFGEGLVMGLKDFGKGVVLGLTRVGSAIGDIAGAAASRAAVLPGMLLYSLPVGRGSTITEQLAMNPYYGNLSNLYLEPTFGGYSLVDHNTYGTIELPEVESRPTMNAEKVSSTETGTSTESSSTAGSSSATPNPDNKGNDDEGDKEKGPLERLGEKADKGAQKIKEKTKNVKEKTKNAGKTAKESTKKAPEIVKNWASNHKKGIIRSLAAWQILPPAYGVVMDYNKETGSKYTTNGFNSTPLGLGFGALRAAGNISIGYHPEDKSKNEDSESESTVTQGGI